MKITVNDIVQYSENSPTCVNGLEFVQSGYEWNDVRALYDWGQRLCKKTNGLSFLLCYSTHNSKDGKLNRKVIRTGKRGRPKTVVTGTEVKPHIHGLFVNENLEIDIKQVKTALTTYCQKSRRRRPHLSRQKSACITGLQIIPYGCNQADKLLSCGSYDFDYFKDLRYNDDFNPIFSQKMK